MHFCCDLFSSISSSMPTLQLICFHISLKCKFLINFHYFFKCVFICAFFSSEIQIFGTNWFYLMLLFVCVFVFFSPTFSSIYLILILNIILWWTLVPLFQVFFLLLFLLNIILVIIKYFNMIFALIMYEMLKMVRME